MMLKAFSVHDKAVTAFAQPFYARHVGEAVRSFTDLVNDPQTSVSRHPEDFVLYAVGEFDDSSGRFVVVEPQRLVSALEVIRDNGGSV